VKYGILVNTKAHKDGREQELNGTLTLPPDVYNGMVITVAKNLPKGASETVHIVSLYAHAPPYPIGICAGGQPESAGGRTRETAIHYVLKPRLGTWLKLFATLLGRVPPDFPRLDHQ
jgi:hypothetical protein